MYIKKHFFPFFFRNLVLLWENHWLIAGDFLSLSWLVIADWGLGPEDRSWDPGQGLAVEVIGELENSSCSSSPLVASYCVFSKRVMSRSSSSPNSPPISDGSPTTITSWEAKEKFWGPGDIFFLGPGPLFATVLLLPPPALVPLVEDFLFLLLLGGLCVSGKI